MEAIKIKLAMVETSYQKGNRQVTVTRGEEIRKLKEVTKIKTWSILQIM